MGCAVAAASQVYFWVMVLNDSGLTALDGGAPIPRTAPTTTATITTCARPGTRLPLLLMSTLLSLLHGLLHRLRHRSAGVLRHSPCIPSSDAGSPPPVNR